MGVTSVNGNISWKFQNDTMTGTLSKRCASGRTDGQAERSVLRAAWSQLKWNILSTPQHGTVLSLGDISGIPIFKLFICCTINRLPNVSPITWGKSIPSLPTLFVLTEVISVTLIRFDLCPPGYIHHNWGLFQSCLVKNSNWNAHKSFKYQWDKIFRKQYSYPEAIN